MIDWRKQKKLAEEGKEAASNILRAVLFFTAVIIILIILGSILAIRNRRHARNINTKSIMGHLEHIIINYKMDKGKYPDTLKDLVPEYIEKNRTDGCLGQRFLLCSAGQEGGF